MNEEVAAQLAALPKEDRDAAYKKMGLDPPKELTTVTPTPQSTITNTSRFLTFSSYVFAVVGWTANTCGFIVRATGIALEWAGNQLFAFGTWCDKMSSRTRSEAARREGR